MKARSLIFVFCFLFSVSSFAEDTLTKRILNNFGFKEYCIKTKSDTVFFYVFNKGESVKSKILVFLSGSTPDPLFTYEIKNGKMESYFWGHQDFRLISEDYIYVLIAKKGLHGVIDESKFRKTPESYLQCNSLDYRVWQADKVIDFCCKHVLSKPKKVVVYGHSEGFNVVAKLLTVNKKVTHAGLWAGSAMPDFFDFMLFNRIQQFKGEVSDSICANNIDTLLMEYRKIFQDPKGRQPGSVYTNKRWISYSEPAINYLTKVNIPLYMIASTSDGNAPIESSYIVPMEFIRLKKNNLIFKTCIGCDHSFGITDSYGKKLSYWNNYFSDFMSWIK